jgi:predicted 2-oxoglutarate/Fe(II)-dependent dioxygenase YbiX
MAYETNWFETKIPDEIISLMERELLSEESLISPSTLIGENFSSTLNEEIRTSSQVWIPSSHWIAGFLWHYITRANNQNFCYDISSIDAGTLQYTIYKKGDFYTWHQDDGLRYAVIPNSELKTQSSSMGAIPTTSQYQRKLSFSLQLSDPGSYEGGELEFLGVGGSKSYLAPKGKGTLIVFDSRSIHRVRKIKSGNRKSLVGWVVGPRWR